MAKITKRFIDRLRPGETEAVHWDDDLPGFGVRVKPNGKGAYCVQYRNAAGVSRRLTVGRVGVLSPDQARREARDKLASAARGDDPVEEKRSKRADVSVSELVELYLAEGPADKPDKKASSWETDASNLRRHVVPLLGRRQVSTLAKADLQRFQSDVSNGRTKAPPTAKGARKRGRIRVTGGAGTAWRATVVLSAMLAWAVDRGHLKANPGEGVRLNKPPSRERFLDDAELARLGDAVVAMEREGVNAASLTIARLLALTGARKTEIASLRWRYVDFQRGALILPDSKTGAKVVPLGAPAISVLMAWGEQFDHLGGDQYVFPAERGNSFHVGYSKVWRRLREKAGLLGVRLHDLRHTHASTGVALNQSLFIIGKVLGHKKARTTEKYAHLELDPVRAAADQTAQRVASAMKGGGTGLSKVVRLERSR